MLANEAGMLSQVNQSLAILNSHSITRVYVNFVSWYLINIALNYIYLFKTSYRQL